MSKLRKYKLLSLNYARQLLAVLLSVLLVTATQMRVYAQAPPAAYVGLNAYQLDQLVAPVALYPDSLLAPILTASTYPDQIAEADSWLNQNLYLAPDQRAAAADAMPWDPSVKALVAFPSVLDNLARNTAWSSQLGNAYFNQPGDVENAVQAMRHQARQCGRLVSTPEQRIVYSGSFISIVPVNPAVVYVPYYDPWTLWEGFVTPWPGWVVVAPPPGVAIGLGIGFGVGIAVGVFAHYGWGFGAWAPAWGRGGVFYRGQPYVSRSVTVINHGNFGRHDHGVFEQHGPGVPGGFHVTAPMGGARAAAERAGVRGDNRNPGGFPPASGVRSPYGNRPAPGGRSAPAARPAPSARPNPGARPARPAAGARPAGQPHGNAPHGSGPVRGAEQHRK